MGPHGYSERLCEPVLCFLSMEMAALVYKGIEMEFTHRYCGKQFFHSEDNEKLATRHLFPLN